MSRARAFLALAPADRRRLVAAATLLVAVRLSLAAVGFPRTRRLVDRVAGATRAPDAPPGRVRWAVSTAAGRLPVATGCLVRALVALPLLRRAGHPAVLRLGVARRDALDAHAWVECDGRVVVGRLDDLDDYARFPALDPGGAGAARESPEGSYGSSGSVGVSERR